MGYSLTFRCARVLVRAFWLAGMCVMAGCARLPPTPIYANAIYGKPRLMLDMEINKDYTGFVELVAFAASGSALMATKNTLYLVANGKAQVIDYSTNDRLVMAPGGGIYGWIKRKSASAQFDFNLVEPSPATGATLLQHGTFGFDGIHLGRQGGLIATSTPLEDWEGSRGAVEYDFWSRGGQLLAKVKYPEKAIGVIDPSGTALLLLGKSNAAAFNANGAELWTHMGGYRKGVISDNAKVALLNPRDRRNIDKAHLIIMGRQKTFELPSPIHHLALSPDGSMGAIAVDKGRLFLFETAFAKLKEVFLSIPGVSFITDVQFIDSGRIALGLIRSRDGIKDKRGHFTFSAASILVVSAAGDTLFQHDFNLGNPATYSPSIDVTYGLQYFSARTPHRVLFVSLQ